MTSIIDRIPGLTDSELALLRENCQRLKASNNAVQQAHASEALPLIEAEQAQRRIDNPGKLPSDRATRKRPVSLGGAGLIPPLG